MEPPPLLQWGHLIIPLLCSTPSAFPTQTPLFFLQSPMRFTFRPPEWWPPIHVSLWLGPYFNCTCHLKCRLLKVFLWKMVFSIHRWSLMRGMLYLKINSQETVGKKEKKANPLLKSPSVSLLNIFLTFKKFSSLRHSLPRIITQCSCNKNTQSIFLVCLKCILKNIS